MKVAELIEELQKQPQDAEVYTEGCDCWGDSGALEYSDLDNTVLITRGGVTPKAPLPDNRREKVEQRAREQGIDPALLP